MLAAQVSARIQDHFGVAVTLEMLFDQPSIAELAACLSSQLQAAINESDQL